MSIVEFLSYLHGLGVKLWVEGDRLCCSIPEGVATPALREELIKRKAELIAFLGGAKTTVGLVVPPIEPVSRDRELPLSFAQQRLWFVDQWEPGSTVYNIPLGPHLERELDAIVLEESLNEIVRHREVLRTTFATLDGQPVQVIAPGLTVSLPVVDLRRLPEAEREDETGRLAAQEARWSFDLERGPLVRATLVQLSEACPEQGRREEYLLLLTVHHIVFDGWSTGILLRELDTLYQAFSAGKPSPLSELSIQYADFTV